MPAVKLMSAVKDSSDFTSLSDISTTTCNYAVLTRWSGYKGSLIDVSTSALTLQNTTLDGGSEDGMFSTEPAIWSNNDLTLKNLMIKNFNNNSTEEGMSAVYCTGQIMVTNCTFENLSSRNTSYDGSALYLTGGGTVSGTSINVKKGYGIACTSSSNELTVLKDVTINNDTKYSIYVASDVKVLKESTGSNIKNVYVAGNKKLAIGDGVTFDSSGAINLQAGASVDILNNLTLTSPATYIAKIQSSAYTSNPIVLTGTGTLVADNFDKFTCAHDGYGINSEGKIVPIGSISITIDNPSGFTEINPGSLESEQVDLQSSGNTTIRFNVPDDAYNSIVTWSGKKPIQYMIDGEYGAVEIKGTSGHYYADIVVSGTIPNVFDPSAATVTYNCTLGLHSLQIYSEAADTSTTVIKKNNFTIVVK